MKIFIPETIQNAKNAFCIVSCSAIHNTHFLYPFFCRAWWFPSLPLPSHNALRLVCPRRSCPLKSADNQYYIFNFALGYFSNPNTDHSGDCPNQSRQADPLSTKIRGWSIFYIYRGGLFARLEAWLSGRIALNFCPLSLTAVHQNLWQSIFYIRRDGLICQDRSAVFRAHSPELLPAKPDRCPPKPLTINILYLSRRAYLPRPKRGLPGGCPVESQYLYLSSRSATPSCWC